MKLVNRDMTRETVTVYVTRNQIFAKIWSKNTHGKWEVSSYFQSYDWEPDEELVEVTIRYIKRTWDLVNPKVIVSK